MAEAYAKKISKELGLEVEVFSAGSSPEREIHPLTRVVLEEEELNLEGQFPKDLSAIPLSEIALVITLCDSARSNCPFIPGAKLEHWALEDPAKAPEDIQLETFRKVRDLIKERVRTLFKSLKEGQS